MVRNPKPEIRHIFFVTDILTWQVMIQRYQLVSETEKSVTVKLADGKEKRYRRESDDGCFCPDLNSAKRKANEFLKLRKANLSKFMDQIRRSEEQVKANKVHDVVPIDLKKLPKRYKF